MNCRVGIRKKDVDESSLYPFNIYNINGARRASRSGVEYRIFVDIFIVLMKSFVKLSVDNMRQWNTIINNKLMIFSSRSKNDNKLKLFKRMKKTL